MPASRCPLGRSIIRVPAVLVVLAIAACASAPRHGGVASAPHVRGDAIVRSALTHVGAPYRNGGADPTGFDCAGLVFYVYREVGIALPRGTPELYKRGRPVTGTLRSGDLLFFSTIAPGASHVGLYVGDHTFVHAPSSRGRVRIEHMDLPYWRHRLVGARRILP